MSTHVVIHGAGDSAFHWHLLKPKLRARGHESVSMDLPCEDDSAGLAEYTDARWLHGAPLEVWPDVPTRYLLCRQDRMFPAEWMREVVRTRLGIEPDEIDSGHCPALSRPRELADRLEGYRVEMGPKTL